MTLKDHRLAAATVMGLASALALAVGLPLAAQEFEVLHSFDNPPVRPIAGLTAGPGNLIYGPASGGSFDAGSTLAFAPPSGSAPGALSLFSSLPAISEWAGGALPLTPLTLASDGYLYGVRDRWSNTTRGAVYRVSPSGAYAVVHELTSAEGSNANGPLVQVGGALYGTLYWGGGNSKGLVFRLWLSDQRFEVVHEFTGGSEGANPEGGLVLRSSDGWLYGTTRFGGSANRGTLYRVSPSSGALETLYQFQDTPGWVSPTGELTVGPDNLLYGAASYGYSPIGGCVFRFDPATGVLAPLHVFDLSDDKGSVPSGGMVISGNTLYGVATGIGYTGPGTIFRIGLAPGSQLEVLYTFNPSRRYSSRLVHAADGKIYGIATGAWRGYDAGNIFRVDPASGSVVTVFTFGNSASGRAPFSLVESAPGVFHVTTREGGAVNRGTVLRRGAEGEPVTQLSFEDGALSDTTRGFLTPASDGLLYGTRSDGGAPGYGSLFTLDPSSGEYQLLNALPTFYGVSVPHGPLLESMVTSNTFYGTAISQFYEGTVFDMTPTGAVSALWAPGALGPSLLLSEPVGRLVETPDGTLYGTFREWWYSSYVYIGGGVFRLEPGSLPQVLKRFYYNEGSDPEAGLTAGMPEPDGTMTLYGTTARGGLYGLGSVFAISTEGAYQLLHSFAGSDGQVPIAEVTRAADGRFYGSTSTGGALNFGTLFVVAADGQFQKIHDFDWTTGAAPETSLVAAADGNLYGVTPSGGAAGGGVLFRYNLAPTASAGGPYELLEGGSVTLTASGSDPQGGSLTFAWDLDADGAFDDGSGASIVFTATTPDRDGDGAYDVAARVTDESGIATVASATIIVRNVAPVVSAGDDVLLEPAATLTRAGTFTDPGPDTWTATVDYGDGTGTSPLALTGMTFTLGHTFALPGIHTVTVVVTDDDGGQGSDSFTVDVGTSEDWIDDLIDDVGDLLDDGSVNKGQANSLIGKLEKALEALQAGNVKKAITMLEAFINEVEAFVRGGVLTREEGDPLLAKARAVLASLG